MARRVWYKFYRVFTGFLRKVHNGPLSIQATAAAAGTTTTATTVVVVEVMVVVGTNR
jgi:hypothetical protein